jgi:hypothetical protein
MMKTRTITEEEITARAYAIYLRNGQHDGRAGEDWALAIQELESESEDESIGVPVMEPAVVEEISLDDSADQPRRQRPPAIPAAAARSSRRGSRRMSDGTS